jgi:hypothetical protein
VVVKKNDQDSIEAYQASLIKGIEKYTLLVNEEYYIVESVFLLSGERDEKRVLLSLLYLLKDKLF